MTINNEHKVAETIFWIRIGTISSPFVILISLGIGIYHSFRFFLETAKELAQILIRIWMK